ncbi:MAG: TRAP transporter substrate-binding protein [Saprospiraceae bacterium]|nr:TRAP transporter substrate-binding protein [Saprospiraceae bacterium]
MRWRSLGLVVVVWFLLSACEQLSSTTSLKLAHGLDVSHPVHAGLQFMADRVAAKSGGKLLIEIYPSQQLGTERQTLELLQIGSLAMSKTSSAVMESFSPNIQVLGLPYIFRSRQQAYNVFDSEIGDELLLQGEDYWLRGLAFLDAGQRSFYTKEKPISTPSDLDGMKIRVQESPTAMNMVSTLGGAPTPISWGELYTALQQGVVDGAENNPPSFYTSRHYEICKYYALNEHTAVPDMLVISTIFWNRLSDQEKLWLTEAADEAVVEQRRLWQAAEQEALDAMEAAGVEISRPDKSSFMAKTADILTGYKEQSPEFKTLIERIQAVPE